LHLLSAEAIDYLDGKRSREKLARALSEAERSGDAITLAPAAAVPTTTTNTDAISAGHAKTPEDSSAPVLKSPSATLSDAPAS